MLNVRTLFDFRITVGILIHNLGAQLEKVLNHRLPLDFYSRSPRNFTVLFTILEKKGRKPLPRILLRKDYSMSKL